MGDVDDKAAELGFEDGDALREYLADVRRPILADYVRMEYVNATMPQAERNKTMRERRLERGLCSRCGRVAPRPEKTTCQPCNDRAAQAVAASREAKRNAPAPDAAIPEPGRLERELQEILADPIALTPAKAYNQITLKPPTRARKVGNLDGIL